MLARSGQFWMPEYYDRFIRDEAHFANAKRYIEANPVDAKLVGSAVDWRWSSARAHLEARNDVVVALSPLLEMAGNWSDFLADETDYSKDIRSHESTGRPLGSKEFITHLEEKLGRRLHKMKTGPK